MLDIGWQELLLICVVTIIIVGPRELPKAIRAVTGFIRKARTLATEFQNGLTEIADADDIKKLKEDMNSIKNGNIPKQFATAADPTGIMSQEMQELQNTQEQIADEFNQSIQKIKTTNKKPNKKITTKKTPAKKTQAKKTQAKKTQAKKTQAKKTQAKNKKLKETMKPPPLPKKKIS